MWNRPDYCLTEGIKAVQSQTSVPASMTWHNHLGWILFILRPVNMHLIYGGKRKQKDVLLKTYLTLAVCHIDLTFSKRLQVIYQISYVKEELDCLIKSQPWNIESWFYSSITAEESVYVFFPSKTNLVYL